MNKQIDDVSLAIAELTRNVRLLQQRVDALEGETLKVTLTKAQPQCYVAFATIHPSGDYYVGISVLEKQGGTAGELEISERHRNGFRIAYDGTAERVTLELWIRDR